MLELLLDHTDFMVLNKPSGMPMHASEEAIIPTAQTLFNYPKLWLVHRLDNGTSGCIILAKTKNAAALLGEQFAEKKVQKYYIALVDKKPKKKQGSIKGDMQKARNGDWKLATSLTNPATTQFFSFSMFPPVRLCIIKPITGKTHQIRVALKSLGAPIIGDSRYKGKTADRLYLHSYSIHFDYQENSFQATCLPTAGEFFSCDSFTHLLIQHDKPWLMKWPKHKS